MGTLVNRYVDWIETELLSKPSQDTLLKPYWSYDEILHIAIQHNNGSNSDVESYVFEVDLTDRLNSFVRSNNYFIVTNISKRFVTEFIESPGLPFICMLFPLTVQLVFYWILRLGIHFKVLNPPNNSQIFISAYWIGWIGIGIFCAILMIALPAVLAYIFLSINKNKSPRYRYLHNLATANIAGLNDQLYESDTIIDFLNSNYRLNLPKDPFRVWKEPFLKRNGEYWIIGFQGRRICLKDATVMEPLAHLLGNPNKEFYAHDFVKGIDEAVNDIKMEASTINEDIRHEYQKLKNEMDYKKLKKSDVQHFIEELETKSGDTYDQENKNEFAHKIKLLEIYMGETFTRNGRENPIRDEKTRSQEALEKAIKRFISNLNNSHPSLADHLKLIRKSSTFCYRPPEDITWDVQF